jgi:hypothetical protein
VVKRRRIKYITVGKFRAHTLSKIETVAYDTNGKPTIALRMQRKKPATVQMLYVQLKKNPDKIVVGSIKLGSWPLQVYYYANSPFQFFIGLASDNIRLPTELRDWLIRTLKKLPKDV